jgi:putative hydrolase of the HAD superfamily
MLQGVFFDFDGVLTMDATGSQSICQYISGRTGLDLDVFTRAYRAFNKDLLNGKRTHRDIWDALCITLGVPLEYQLLEDAFHATPIHQAMVELVRQLKSAGYKTGLITDNKRDRIDVVIRHNHWEELFDAVVISADIGSGKEEAAIFQAALRAVKLPASACAFIDNTAKNLIVPQDMGIAALYYDHERKDVDALKAALRGFGASF